MWNSPQAGLHTSVIYVAHWLAWAISWTNNWCWAIDLNNLKFWAKCAASLWIPDIHSSKVRLFTIPLGESGTELGQWRVSLPLRVFACQLLICTKICSKQSVSVRKHAASNTQYNWIQMCNDWPECTWASDSELLYVQATIVNACNHWRGGWNEWDFTSTIVPWFHLILLVPTLSCLLCFHSGIWHWCFGMPYNCRVYRGLACSPYDINSWRWCAVRRMLCFSSEVELEISCGCLSMLTP